MNRLFTALAAILLCAITAFGNTATWSAVDYAVANNWESGTTTVGNTTIKVNDDLSFIITDFSNPPKFYTQAIRVYKNSKITVNCGSGVTLTGMVITGETATYTAEPSAVSTGKITKSGSTLTWTGSTTSKVEITCSTASSNNQLRIKTIEFTYSKSGGSGGSGGSTSDDKYTALYILGDMNGWKAVPEWKMSTTDGVHYTLKVNEMPAVSEFKVADETFTKANWGGCTAIRPNIEYYLLWNEGNATMDAISANATITFNTATRGFKVSSSVVTGGMKAPSGSAQGWPYQYQGVMLQGFYWDSYNDTNWGNLEYQATELANFFKLIWVPNSAKPASDPGMGYDPVYWFSHYDSSFGSEKALRSLIKTLKAKGTGLIADVVVNHRSGVSNWTDFPAEKWNGITYSLNHKHICSNDEVAWASGQPTPGGNYDTGDNFDGSRDLDHTNALVQANCKAYCQFLLEDLGYAGFRYDMVKGYGGQYVKLYNEYSVPTYSVGEYFDNSYNNVAGWIESTGRTSAAFDFPFKFAVNEAFASGDMTKLVWTANGNNPQPCGLIHNGYPQYAVTFVDNHDTSRDGSRFQGNIPAANAFMLMSPGTPCVYLPHWQQYKTEIAALIGLRNSVGIHNCSRVEVLRSTRDCYMAKVYGTKGDAIVKIGSAMITPDGFNDADLKAYGPDYAVWTKVHVTGQAIPKDYPADLYLIGNVNSNNWSTTAPVKANTASNGVYTWNNVTIGRADGSAHGNFSIVTTKGANWDVINASHRYGAATDNELINGEASVKPYPANFTASAAKNWALAPGQYKIVVDLGAMKISVTSKQSDETVYFIAPDYTGVSGTPLLNANGTSAGSASNNLLNKSFTNGKVTLTSAGGGSSKAGSYGALVRWYKGNILNLEAQKGYAISRIEVAYSTSSYSGPFTATSGVVNASTNPVVWTGNSPSVSLTATGQMRFSYIAVSVVPSTGDTSSEPAEEIPGAFYDPVNYISDLEVGANYIIVAQSVGKAMGNTLSKGSTGFLNAVDVTVDTNKSVYAAEPAEIMHFTLEKGTNASSYAFRYTAEDGNDYYLTCPSTSTTLSRTASKTTSNNIKVTQGASLATVQFVKNNRRLNYGTANGGCFQAYAATSSSKLVIYKRRNSGHSGAQNITNSKIVNFLAPVQTDEVEGVLLYNSDGSDTASGTNQSAATLNGVEFKAEASDGSTICTLENSYAKTYYPGAYGDHVRWYKNAVFTLSPSKGYKITRVEVEYTGATYSGPFSAPIGNIKADADHQVITWTGNATTPLDLTADDQIRFTSMSVTLRPSGMDEVETEEFETPVGMYVILDNEAGWEHPYAYTWTYGDIDRNAPWPGVAMTKATDSSDKWIYQFNSEKAPGFIIFNDGNNGGEQTEDLEYVNNQEYSNGAGDGVFEIFMVGDFTNTWQFMEAYRFNSEDGIAYTLDVERIDAGAEFKIASRYYRNVDFGGVIDGINNGSVVTLLSDTQVNNRMGQSVVNATVNFNLDSAELQIVGDDAIVTGVEEILDIDEAETEYFNLQGIRITRPDRGIVIMRRGSSVSKQLLR